MKNTPFLNLRCRFYPSVFTISTILLLCFFSCQNAEEISDKPIIQFSQFINEEPLEITITTNLESLFEKKENPVENELENFQKAKCEILIGGELFFDGKIKVKKRGITRKKICAIPPVMMKFGKKEKAFRIKLVTPCKEDENAQQLVYKEYLAYQMYSDLTPHSFKTQLVNITYRDKKDKIPPIEATGFLIEEVHEAAERMTAKLLHRHEKIKYLNQNCYRLFTMFQYCIGNTDWNLSKRHNIKLIRKHNSNSPIPVPYDFDYAGLVDAPYAIPHPQLPIDNVRERHFMWRGKNYDGFEEVVELFVEMKPKMLEKIESFDLLEKEEKEEMINYIESFFLELNENDDFLS
ncbi:MAG: hypothetical protein AB8F94_24995 [Saprospiraceae bacterium]